MNNEVFSACWIVVLYMYSETVKNGECFNREHKLIQQLRYMAAMGGKAAKARSLARF